MNLNKNPYKGTRDFFPEKKRELNFIFDKLSSCAELFGHEPYEGPLLEEVDLYLAKSGEELVNEQIYSFEDRGKRKVAIRPEMTPTLARMVSRVHRERAKPFRWYSIPTLMRYERPQKGRLREHFQFNCDIFGAPTGQGEIEILSLLVSALTSFGANEKQFTILLNDRNIIDAVFKNVLGLDEDKTYKLYKIIDRIKKVKPEQAEKDMAELGLNDAKKNILKSYLALTTFSDLTNFLNDNGIKREAESFTTIVDSLKFQKIEKYFKYDPTIVRGLDYYTGLVFECFDLHPENNRAICGGGAYGNLLQIFNEPALPGVGFGLGDVTLSDFLVSHKLMPNFDLPTNKLFLAYMDDGLANNCMAIANSLRAKKISCVNSLESLKFKKAINLAEKRGAEFFVFLGDNEFEQDEAQLKNLKTGKQDAVTISNIDSWIKVLNHES